MPGFLSTRFLEISVCFALICVLLTGCSEKSPHIIDKSTPTNSLAEIEKREAELDQTLWRREILAVRCERVFNQIWDALRAGSKLSIELEKFPQASFSSLAPSEKISHPHQIEEINFKNGPEKLSSSDFASQVKALEDAGYVLEMSDWRQPEFNLNANECSSLIQCAFYVSHREKPGRWLARGKLLVTWDRESLEGEKPEARNFDWREFRLLARPLEPLFKLAAQQEFTLPPGLESLDANLMVQDLNRDGLPEIMIGTSNLLLWNKKTKFTPDDLFTDPRIKAFCSLIGDFDRDGMRDLLVASPEGVWKLTGTGEGKFADAKLAWKAPEPMLNPFVMTSGDLNGDGAPEVWLAQYKLPFIEGQMPHPFYNANDGFPSYLLVNDGFGGLEDGTAKANLAAKRFRRTYSASFVDLDGDRNLDLAVVSDFYGLDLYRNLGKGVFEDVTAQWVTDPHAFGMAHAIADLDGNHTPDLLMVGMTSDAAHRLDQWQAVRPGFETWLPYRAKMSSGNKLFHGGLTPWRLDARSKQLDLAGWAWGVTSFDFDNDSHLDLYLANGHISRGSSADYESEFWRHDIFVGTSEHVPAHDQYFQRKANALGELSYGGFWKNAFFLNQNAKSFLEIGWLLGLAEEKDCRDAVSADLNQDGKLDLVFTSFEHWPRLRQILHIYLNQTEGGNWIGFHLEEGKGVSLAGAKAWITMDSGKTQTRWLINGDSFHSQHPTTAHFGLGSSTNVVSFEIEYPNGKKKALAAPAVNAYQFISN